MKSLLVVLAALMIFAPQAYSQAAAPVIGTLEITTNGQIQPLTLDKQSSIKFWLHKLMLSALYQDVVAGSTLDEWQKQLKAQKQIYCRYSSSVTLAIPERVPLLFDEVLLPIHSNAPDFIYIRRGQSILRLAKYDPWVYVKLATESGIPVHPSWLAVERYSW